MFYAHRIDQNVTFRAFGKFASKKHNQEYKLVCQKQQSLMLLCSNLLSNQMVHVRIIAKHDVMLTFAA